MLCWEGSGPLDCNSNDGKKERIGEYYIVRVDDLIWCNCFPECLEEFNLSWISFMEMKNLEDEKVGNIISMDFLRGVG